MLSPTDYNVLLSWIILKHQCTYIKKRLELQVSSTNCRRYFLCISCRHRAVFCTELQDSVFIYHDSWGCVDTKYTVNGASVSFNKLPQKKYEKKWFKLRTYWWVQNPWGIMQLTQAHGSVLLQQPVAVKANYPRDFPMWGLGSIDAFCNCQRLHTLERGGSAENLSQPITANVLFMSGHTWSVNNKAIL